MTVNWGDYGGVLFDLDGVITPTAEVHMHAWSRMFNTYLMERSMSDEQAPAPYTDQDYYDYVDGKPRYDGVRSFLESRGFEAPDELVKKLGDLKNDMFGEVLHDEGVTAYPGSVRLLESLKERGMPMAIVSSSRNAPAVLDAAGVTHFFSTVVHGGVAAERGLAGKPAPDTFWEAADELGVPRDRAVVLEDATSGVAAGAAGKFPLVIGVDRGAGAEALTAAGADLVVRDLAELL
jgi:beta-phosphoglucomutase family hydrolase